LRIINTYLYLCKINAIQMKTAVIVARFQSPYLHEGHKQLIEEVMDSHNKLIIVLGISPIPGRRNPFDFHTRERMIKKEYPSLTILPLSDHPSDTKWSKNLDILLKNTFPTEQFLLFGSRDSFIPYYEGQYETVELPEHGEYSATSIRSKYADKVFDSKDFRAGILYGLHTQYKKVYPTVDVALFRNGKKEISLAQKETSPQWRLVGGFTDPEDESYAVAAKRELLEECGELEVGEMLYETSARIDDWRYRPEVDKIITTLFSCDLLYGEPKADDDIVAVKWFPVQELPHMLQQNHLSTEHRKLFQHLIKKYANA
jgi:bifunctional NMN adenylyltransferase/nudix hydrolase